MEILKRAVVVLLVASSAVTLTAQRGPSTLPLLTESSLQYLGAFKVPNTENGGWLSFGGLPIAHNPANNSLFIGNRDHKFAEVSIVAPVNTTDVKAMNRGVYLQGFADPTEGHWNDAMSGNGFESGGLLVSGDKLLVNGHIYYDATGSQRLSHFSRSTNLKTPSFSGFSQLTGAPNAGYVAGWMTHVPSELQAALGGPVLTGRCCIPIVSRTSNGPAAFAFDPSKLGQKAVPAVPLLYYTGDRATLGPWEGSNETYGATTTVGGMAFIAGTRSLLYIGRNGLGRHCYGNGTKDQALAGKPSPDGSHWCYDPTASSKGSHAYPYRHQVWAYDANDLAAVKSGKLRPWDVKPYTVIPITVPGGMAVFGGVGYDAQKQLLYVSHMWAEGEASGHLPLIHVFKVNVPGPTPNPVP